VRNNHPREKVVVVVDTAVKVVAKMEVAKVEAKVVIDVQMKMETGTSVTTTMSILTLRAVRLHQVVTIARSCTMAVPCMALCIVIVGVPSYSNRNGMRFYVEISKDVWAPSTTSVVQTEMTNTR
jgi:hypothetical protein